MIGDLIEFEFRKLGFFNRRRDGADHLSDDIFRRIEGQYGLLDRDVRWGTSVAHGLALPEHTCVRPPGARASLDRFGNIAIEIGRGGRRLRIT